MNPPMPAPDAAAVDAFASGPLTEATRLGLPQGAAARLFTCRTTLVEGGRAGFPRLFAYAGTRALVLPEMPAKDCLCIARAPGCPRSRKEARA